MRDSASTRTARSSDGTTLTYDVLGSGPVLVYITGASCFRSFLPIRQDVKAFAHEFTVVSYDRRGRGDSDDMGAWSVEREVEDIAAVVDAVGGRAHLYGHSSGAVLALEAGLRLGDKVDRVVLYDAPYVHDEAERAEYAELAREVDRLLGSGDNARAMRTFLRGIGMPAAFIAALPVMPGWRTMKALAPTLAYDIALTRDLPPVGRAAQIEVPLQVMVGERSGAGVNDVAEQLAAAAPGAALVRLAGQDHLVSAKALLPHLVAFLKQPA